MGLTGGERQGGRSPPPPLSLIDTTVSEVQGIGRLRREAEQKQKRGAV